MQAILQTAQLVEQLAQFFVIFSSSLLFLLRQEIKTDFILRAC